MEIIGSAIRGTGVGMVMGSKERVEIPKGILEIAYGDGKLLEMLAAGTHEKKNFMISPASLACVLQMAALAADGDTRKEILEFTGNKEHVLNSEAVKTKNFFVVNKSGGHEIGIKKSYEELLKTRKILQASAFELTDENRNTLADEINRLVCDATDGKIKEIVKTEDFNREKFVSLLVNALVFSGTWQSEIFPIDHDFIFRDIDEKEHKVAALKMSGDSSLRYYSSRCAEAFSVRYKEDDGRYTFWGILPNKSQKLDFSHAGMLGMKEPDMAYELYVRIPKFKFKSGTGNMKAALQKMGINKAFDRVNADFTKGFIFPEDDRVYIDTVKQIAEVDFNEKGTEAKAATYSSVQLATTCCKPPIKKIYLDFDRPFLFIIWDNKENVPLFTGQVYEPAGINKMNTKAEKKLDVFNENFEKLRLQMHTSLEQKKLPDAVFQMEITGAGEGIFYIKNHEGQLEIEPYNYYDCTAEIQMPWDTLFALVTAKISLSEAVNDNRVFIFPKEPDGLQKIMQFFLQMSQKTEITSLVDPHFFGPGINIDVTRVFPVIVMATMSSGKSTLINALLGEEVLPSRNEACTAKIFSILDDDTATKEKLYVTTADQTVTATEEGIAEELERANNDDNVTEILLTGQIKGVQNTEKSMLIVDTPGPNNSRDNTHAQITERVLEKINGGLILYLLNATQMGINDDREFLQMISQKLKEKKELKILFVVNKVDELDEERESILNLLLEVKEYLEANGIRQPEIIPVSALAAGLFKKAEKGEPLTRKQRNDFQMLYSIFESKELRLGAYAALPDLSELQREVEVGGEKYTVMQLEKAIDNTGIKCLEGRIQKHQILSSYIEPLAINVKGAD